MSAYWIIQRPKTCSTIIIYANAISTLYCLHFSHEETIAQLAGKVTNQLLRSVVSIDVEILIDSLISINKRTSVTPEIYTATLWPKAQTSCFTLPYNRHSDSSWGVVCCGVVLWCVWRGFWCIMYGIWEGCVLVMVFHAMTKFQSFAFYIKLCLINYSIIISTYSNIIYR